MLQILLNSVWLVSTGSERNPVLFCERSNEPLGSLHDGEFLIQLRDCRIPRKGSTPWNWWVGIKIVYIAGNNLQLKNYYELPNDDLTIDLIWHPIGLWAVVLLSYGIHNIWNRNFTTSEDDNFNSCCERNKLIQQNFYNLWLPVCWIFCWYKILICVMQSFEFATVFRKIR